ncbi:MAG: hypothetical protein QOE09_1373 [Ilumatobacteraceae bacterium]|jgi:hypothetical protein
MGCSGTGDSGTRHGGVIPRLKKVDVERLLTDYDIDPIGALTTALRVILDLPDATWPTLLAAAPIEAARRNSLLAGEEPSLDRLASELNEFRSLIP